MEAILNDHEFWLWLGRALGIILALGIATVVAQFSAHKLKDTWYYLREYEPALIAQFDEPFDTPVVRLDRLLDRIVPADWDKLIATLAPPVLRAMADTLDALYMQESGQAVQATAGAPAQETGEPGGAVK